MKVALTGATGVLGSAVLREALDSGHEVRALVRTRAGRELTGRAGVDWIPGDLEDAAALSELVAGADAIVHSAYSETDDPETFVQANIVATLRLLTHAGSLPARQFVYVSSLAVYGREPWRLAGAVEHPLDEDFPLWPGDFYAAHKLAMEKMVIAASGDSGLDASAFRIGCVLGNYPTPERDYLARFLGGAQNRGVIDERVGAYVVTATDAARILVDALGDDTVAGGIFNTFDRWMDFAELAVPLGKLLGREISVTCPAAPTPHPPLRNDRLLKRRPVFETESRIEAMLRALIGPSGPDGADSEKRSGGG